MSQRSRGSSVQIGSSVQLLSSQGSRGSEGSSTARALSQLSLSESSFSSARVTEQTLYYACKYGFKPEGVRDVTQWFMEGLGTLDLPVNYDFGLAYDTNYHSFSFVAPNYLAKDSLGVLVKAAKRMINIECDYPEEGEDHVLKPNSTRLWVLEESDLGAVPLGPLGDESFPVGIRFYPERSVWRCNVANKGMDSVITKEVQDRIMDSTGARLVEDLNQQKIFVASNDRSLTILAVKKLKNVERFWVDRERVDFHVYFTETITDCQMCFVRFPDVKKKLVETTLLEEGAYDNLQEEYHLLKHRLTVRCCPRVYRRETSLGQAIFILKEGEKLRPVIKEDEKAIPSLRWASYSYAKKGNWADPKSLEYEDAIKPTGAPEVLTEVLTRSDISNWTQTLPDPKEAIMTEHLRIVTPSATTNSENTRPRAQAFMRNDSASSTHFMPQYNTPESVLPVSRNSDLLLSPRPLPQGHSSFGTTSPMDLAVPANEMFPVLPPSNQNAAGDMRSVQSDSDRLIDFADEGVPKQTCLPKSDSTSGLEDLQGVVIPNMNELIPQQALDIMFGPELPSASSAVQDHEDPTQDELSTRKFHQTMGQKAPAISKAGFFKDVPPSMIPSHEFLESVEPGLRSILSQMRSHGGKLTLKAELGRLIIAKKIDTTLIYADDNSYSCDLTAAQRILSSARVEFTNMVITLPREAQFVLEMTDGKGQRMWKDQPTTTWPKVRYLFCCRDKKIDTEFEVEMDGESHGFEVKSLPYTFGVINAHGTLRNWDWRIVGEGSESLGSKYKDWAQDFVQSISIPENCKKFEMTFELADAHEVEVLSLRIRRECDHENTKGECTLHISEVEDMCMLTSHMVSKTSYWMKTHDEETDPPKTSTTKWYEFSITSHCADEAFKENIKLDIGEEATWNMENLNNEGLVWNLCHPMSEIVSKGDGLGFWNLDARPATPTPNDQVSLSRFRAVSGHTSETPCWW